MFDIADALADEHDAALAALPRPLSPVCIRSLIAACGRDHRHAQGQRKSALAQRARFHGPRAARLTRSAEASDDRAAELLAEVR